LKRTLAALLVCAASALPAIAQTHIQTHSQPAHTDPHPVRFNLIYRSRVEGWEWFAAPLYENSYGYVDSLLRLSLSQTLPRWDWKAELSQPAILDAPSNAVAPGAQGQLGLGGTYYASNGNNAYPAAAFFKQGYIRYHFGGPHSDKNIRIGRFEFFGGMETHPHNPTLLWLQTRRIQQRLLGNFGFTNAQRSFDGADAHYGRGSWDITAFAARADQGVFNMNGNPELNVDAQYLAFTQNAAHGHVLWRAFAMGYHDGRTGLTKTDNRPLNVRTADHHNIRLGTYGGDLIAEAPAGPGNFDFLFWGAYQNGSWGTQSDSANAAALEGGYHLTSVRTAPWLRGGWYRGSGDDNPSDNKHNTFFQLLPTPRGYARLPCFNLMNNTDEFVSVIDKPARKLALRSDLHWLQLTSSKDLWYLGGGAFDNKVFGFTGRPSNGYSSLGTLADISADWAASRSISASFYYGYTWGKSVVTSTYPTGRRSQFAYAELDYHFSTPLSR
jgi:Alginate export